MSIPKLTAEGAVIALTGLSTSALVTVMSRNPHLFEKHYSKQKAKEAADNIYAQGYFKRVDKVSFNNSGEFESKVPGSKQKTLLERQFKIKLNGEGNIGAKDRKKVKGQVSFNAVITDPSEMANVIRLGLRQAGECRESNNEALNRFLFVTDVPEGYVGRAIKANEAHGDKTADRLVIVIDASSRTSPQVVTAYPATAAYTTRTALLV